MAGEQDYDSWAQYIRAAYHVKPLNAFRVIPLGLDGSDAVALKVDPDGTLHTTGGGGGAGAADKVEDAPAASGDTGVFILGVRNDLAATTLTSDDLDYGPIATDAKGRVITASERQHNTATGATDMGTQIMGVRNEGETTLSSANLNHSEIGVDRVGRLFVTGTSGMLALKVDGSAVPQPVFTAPDEAGYATANLAAVNLTSTTVWTVALATPSTAWRAFKFVNTSNEDIQVSLDASTIHDYVPAGTGFLLDLRALDLEESEAISVRNNGTTALRGRLFVTGYRAE